MSKMGFLMILLSLVQVQQPPKPREAKLTVIFVLILVKFDSHWTANETPIQLYPT